MRCLYCGKELALFKRLRGGEFCSDAHRLRYQEEYTQLALNRLMQANAQKENENDSSDQDAVDNHAAEPETTATKRREKSIHEETPAAAAPVVPALVVPAPTVPAAANMTAQRIAVLEPEPARVSIPEPSVEPAVEEPAIEENGEVEHAAAAEEPAPAGMTSFLVECPAPETVDPPAPVGLEADLPPALPQVLPRLEYFQPDPGVLHLDSAGRIELSLFSAADFATPPRERGLELREFVRGVPQVAIHLKPAVDSGFESVREALEVTLDAHPPDSARSLWLPPEVDLTLHGAEEILLGDLARLDFAVTDWGQGADTQSEIETESAPPPEEPSKAPVLAGRIEAARVEPVAQEPAAGASLRPEPVHFEPVHIDPVFMARIAGQDLGQDISPDLGEDMAGEAIAENTFEAPPVPEEPAVEEPVAQQPAPVPATITKPLPVTLHGLAPVRGKPVQVFTSAVVRVGDLQVPRSTGLPLRPVMVLGASTKPASADQASPAAKTIPIPPKGEPRTEAKSRKAEVRVVPVQVKEPPKPEPVKSEPVKPVSVKPEPVKPASVAPAAPAALKPEPVKAAPAPAKPTETKPAEAKSAPVKSFEAKPTDSKQAEAKPAAPAKPAKSSPTFQPEAPKPKAPTEARSNVPEPAKTQTAPAAELPKQELPKQKPAPVEEAGKRLASPAASPSQELDTLGLPKLSFQQKETFWSNLPTAVRLGVIAAVLALVIAGIVLTSRGSGSNKPAVAAPAEPVMVEQPALANTAGWQQDWFADRAGAKQGRHVDILKGTLTQRDYRLMFEGQIEHGALGWVFRADNKSFYVEKIQVVTPGLHPVVALEHFAVINGVETPRVQVPLATEVHLDTLYKVRMDAIGDRFTTWVQDEKADQWTDGQLSVGGVGLYYDSGDSAKLRDTLNVIPLKLQESRK